MHKYEPPKKVAIAGARGYSGIELLRLLQGHSGAKVTACLVRGERDFKPADHLLGDVPLAPMADFESVMGEVDTLFLATPAEVSMEWAPKALAQGVDVIDLSGAFRLSPVQAKATYGLTDEAAGFLKTAQYGLVPWVGPAKGVAGGRNPKNARLVANPGCYATAVLLALLPLVKEKLIDPSTLVIDAKSGASGAGRKAAESLHFSEVAGECLPYKVGKHQHLPEIREQAAKLAGAEIDPMFVTHLLPVDRGIIAGIYARTKASAAAIEAAYRNAYGGYPFLSCGALDESRPQLLSLKRLAGTPRTEIRYELCNDQLYVFSLLDNLMKGAASQAVENFNRLYDFPIETGAT